MYHMMYVCIIRRMDPEKCLGRTDGTEQSAPPPINQSINQSLAESNQKMALLYCEYAAPIGSIYDDDCCCNVSQLVLPLAVTRKCCLPVTEPEKNTPWEWQDSSIACPRHTRAEGHGGTTILWAAVPEEEEEEENDETESETETENGPTVTNVLVRRNGMDVRSVCRTTFSSPSRPSRRGSFNYDDRHHSSQFHYRY